MVRSPVGVVLPRAGEAREKLRGKGQFWTPDWVADAMVTWAARDSDHVFDPGLGGGAFFLSAKRNAALLKRKLRLFGCEIDESVLKGALHSGLQASDLKDVQVGDFIETAFPQMFGAIVANPPYVRHHRFSVAYKEKLQALAVRCLGEKIDGRAGLHIFFLIKSLSLLQAGGRLAFIVPADTCDGRFAPALWRWIGRKYAIDGVVTFAPAASPFPGVDTNAVILLISNRPPSRSLKWAKVKHAETENLRKWMAGDLPVISNSSIEVYERSTEEALRTGLSRDPVDDRSEDNIMFGELFRVIRGIATGDNNFFFLRSDQIKNLNIPMKFFVRAIGRTRDHVGDGALTLEQLDRLDQAGRPTFLLSLGREREESLPAALQHYLRIGEKKQLPDRPLIRQRKPWFRMERREPPAWLFAYLGRRSCRFIRNEAGAVPLTGFLCIYPREEMKIDLVAATLALNDPRTLANLPRVAKSYGGGALKVEPRNLERLPIPRAVIDEYRISGVRQPLLI